MKNNVEIFQIEISRSITVLINKIVIIFFFNIIHCLWQSWTKVAIMISYFSPVRLGYCYDFDHASVQMDSSEITSSAGLARAEPHTVLTKCDQGIFNSLVKNSLVWSMYDFVNFDLFLK